MNLSWEGCEKWQRTMMGFEVVKVLDPLGRAGQQMTTSMADTIVCMESRVTEFRANSV